jgi:DNA-directed RNA polymerase specialized sigma24 family protein
MKDFVAGGNQDLSPDIDWLLGGGQAEVEALSAALTKDFFVPLYQLALCLLDNQKEAALAALEALIAAQSKVSRYNGQVSAQTWIFRQALPIFSHAVGVMRWRKGIQAFLPGAITPEEDERPFPTSQAEAELWLSADRLPLQQKYPYFLLHVLNWNLDEIALLFNVSPDEVRSRLRQASKQIQARLNDLEALPAPFESLKKRWSVSNFGVEELGEIAVEVAHQVERRGKRKQT